MTNDKTAIQALWAFKEEQVVLPGGATITLREMTGAQRDAYEQSMVKTVDGTRQADLANMRAKLVAPGLVGEDGSPLFSVDELAQAPASFLDPLWLAAQRLNGMTPAAVEEAAKN